MEKQLAESEPPFLVTLGMDAATFGRVEASRRRYFPPARNIVPAHLSLFHHLPGSERGEIEATLDAAASRTPPICLRIQGLRKLGYGMAAVVHAPALNRLRGDLARSFHGWLNPQDRQAFRPHVTLMNKAAPLDAALALAELREVWEPWVGTGESLQLWRYLGGPWRLDAEYPLRGDCGTTGEEAAHITRRKGPDSWHANRTRSRP